MMLLEVSEESVKWFHWMLTLQNDEILMQHNTLHVPNQAIPMNTFHQYPNWIVNENSRIICRYTYQYGDDSETVSNVKSNFKTFFLNEIIRCNWIRVCFFFFTFDSFLIISRSIRSGKYECNNAQNAMPSVQEFEKFVIDIPYSINAMFQSKINKSILT